MLWKREERISMVPTSQYQEYTEWTIYRNRIEYAEIEYIHYIYSISALKTAWWPRIDQTKFQLNCEHAWKDFSLVVLPYFQTWSKFYRDPGVLCCFPYSRGKRDSTVPQFIPCMCTFNSLQMKDQWESNIKSGSNLYIPRNEIAWPHYFQSRIKMFCLPISAFMYLPAIYIFPWLVCLFFCIQIGRQILGIYKSLTDTWM